jgi:hypothetical protein
MRDFAQTDTGTVASTISALVTGTTVIKIKYRREPTGLWDFTSMRTRTANSGIGTAAKIVVGANLTRGMDKTPSAASANSEILIVPRLVEMQANAFAFNEMDQRYAMVIPVVISSSRYSVL